MLQKKLVMSQLNSDLRKSFIQKNNDDAIIVKRACVHNLKNVSVSLPRNKLIVLTGPSGSGKSSLAFDTIYAEGQRRYVESLSVYARQFVQQLEKPDVESITGLSPTISIEQKTTSHNPRSTVGTVTEIYDYLRLLFTRISKPKCYNCDRDIQSQTSEQIIDQIISLEKQTKISILSPIVRGRKGEYVKELISMRSKGFARARIDGKVFDLAEEISLEKNKKHNIDIYVDRLVLKPGVGGLRDRVKESVDLALRMGDGMLILLIQKGDKTEEKMVSQKFACSYCEISYPTPEPRAFSFNSPMGACPECDGLGIDLESLNEEEQGTDDEDQLEKEDHSLSDDSICINCKGSRLRIESRHFFIHGKSISQLCDFSIKKVKDFFTRLPLSDREKLIADRMIKEIIERLEFLERVGVSYLTLSRKSKSLSGGENQRIRLARQIGSALIGVIYVLDEPSIGLHPRDHHRLLDTLDELKNLGNTVVVVEHDRDTIEKADYIVDLGPGAGNKGGVITAEGTLSKLKKNPKSLTALYLTNKKQIEIPKNRRPMNQKKIIEIKGANRNNLKNIDVKIPLGTFTCVTGVSGSGKSTLIMDILYRKLMSHFFDSDVGKINAKSIEGLEHIDKVIDIDQSPIGRTPRSNPATYIGLFGLIRTLFSRLPDAQIRGYKPGRFSFNIKGGRCEACEGNGNKKIEMHFLPDVRVLCTACKGRRYNRETLEIRYKGKNIAEVLNLTATEAFGFFSAVPSIYAKMKILNDVGLGYIHLGQSAITLSGGEAQRIKLAKELSRKSTGKTFYILDEPSTGLHFDDIQKLMNILQLLVSQGNTVLVIEHNLDIIKVADYLIDLGPEGGAGGGEIVAKGTPEQVIKVRASLTGQHLAPLL